MHDILSYEHSAELKNYKVDFMILDPDLWVRYPNRTPLTWQKIKFGKPHADQIPNDCCGVYSFVVIPEIANHVACAYLLYVGETQRDFRTRYREYLDDQNPSKRTKRVHIREMLTKWQNHLWFCYAPITETKLIKQVEADLINSYLPPYCKEYPAEVREPMKVLR